MKEKKIKLNEIIKPSKSLIMPAEEVLLTAFTPISGALLTWLEMEEDEKKDNNKKY